MREDRGAATRGKISSDTGATAEMFNQRVVIGIGVLGLILIVFGSVWITTVFSRFEQIPSDWDQVDELVGTFTFVDEAFLIQVQENPTISQLLSSPGAGDLFSDPAILLVLGDPAVEQIVSSPELLALLQDPGALQLLGNPTLASLLTNPTLLQLLQDPAVLQALQDPAGLQQLLNHPVAGPLLANPEVLALLQDPGFQSLLQSGAIATFAAQPQLLALLGNPAVGSVLSNPGVQALLADPAALSLVLDPRTQKVLANPADLPMITVPVLLHRVRQAVDTDGDRLFINEQVSTLDPTTGQEVPGFDKTNVGMIVDRKSKEYLEGEYLPQPGIESGRSGFWGLPFDVDKDRIYPSWVTAAERPLDAEYRGTEKVQGLETFLFVVDVTNMPLGVDDPVTGLPLVVDALITTWNEPKTGSTVKIEDFDAVSALDPAGNKYPRFVADVNYTEETITELVQDAKNNRNKIVWFGTNMPWMSMGLGIFLAAGAAGLMGLTTLRKERGS